MSDRFELLDPREHEGQYALGRYVETDLNLVASCNTLFAYIQEGSPSEYFGTTSEITWAFANSIPVLLVTNKSNPHPFHLYMSKYVRTDLDYGIKTLIHTVKDDHLTADYIRKDD